MAISKIKSESIDLTDTGYTFGDLLVSGDLTIDTSSLTVDSTNNRVGIGTTSPNSVLHIVNSSPLITLEDSDASLSSVISGNSGNVYLNTATSNRDVIIQGSGTEVARITGDGFVGIGSTTFSYGKLEIADSGYVASAVRSTDASGSVGILAANSSNEVRMGAVSNHPLSIRTNNVEAMSITSAGNVVIGASSPGTAGIVRLISVASGNYTAAIQATSNTSATNWARFDIKNHNSSNPFILYQDQSGNANIRNDNSTGILGFLTGGSNEAMRITSSGDVGIGTSSPTQKLHLATSDSGSLSLRLENTRTPGESVVSLLGKNSSGTVRSFVMKYDNADRFRLTTPDALPIAFETNDIERMRIASNGDVGIGTNNPLVKTHIFNGSDSPNILFIQGADTTTENLFIGVETGKSTITAGGSSNTNNSLVFRTSNAGAETEAMRIDSSGNVLVGTTSSYGGMINFLTSTSRINAIVTRPATNITYNAADFQNSSGTGVGGIGVTASSTNYATSSDYRLKENVVDITGATERLKQLQPKRFNFIVDADTTVDGFLAHEVSSIVPEAVSGEKDEVDADGNPVYQGIDQSKLVPLLTAALKESLTKIDELEQRLSALENS